jgi:hypothetical protein
MSGTAVSVVPLRKFCLSQWAKCRLMAQTVPIRKMVLECSFGTLHNEHSDGYSFPLAVKSFHIYIFVKR